MTGLPRTFQVVYSVGEVVYGEAIFVSGCDKPDALDQFPARVGSLASQIRGYEAIRSFVSSATLYALFDLPFGLLFLLVIMAIAGPAVGFVSLAFFVLALLVGLAFRGRIEGHTENSAGHTNRKLGLLVDAVDGAEMIKASGSSW